MDDSGGSTRVNDTYKNTKLPWKMKQYSKSVFVNLKKKTFQYSL